MAMKRIRILALLPQATGLMVHVGGSSLAAVPAASDSLRSAIIQAVERPPIPVEPMTRSAAVWQSVHRWYSAHDFGPLWLDRPAEQQRPRES